MNQKERAETIKRLKADGYKIIAGMNNYYISQSGNVFSLITGQPVNPHRKGKSIIKIEGKSYNAKKLTLQTFKNEPYRENQQITHIDGNRGNLHFTNLKYTRIYETDKISTVNESDLLTAIRCYHEVGERYKVTDQALTRMYLSRIIETRDFYRNNSGDQNTAIFESYMQGLTNSIAATAKAHGLSVHDCAYIVNGMINKLASEILIDLKAGLLKVKEYLPKQKTKTQVIRETNEYLKGSGLKPLPLRKKSDRETLREYEKWSNELKKEIAATKQAKQNNEGTE